VVNATARLLYPRTRRTGCWVGQRSGQEGCGKSRQHRDAIPKPSGSKRVAKPTEPCRPTKHITTLRSRCATCVTCGYGSDITLMQGQCRSLNHLTWLPARRDFRALFEHVCALYRTDATEAPTHRYRYRYRYRPCVSNCTV
jgi:hypothetical protein